MAVIDWAGVSLVVFDLDDTLYPERDYVFSGYQAVARWLASRAKCPDDLIERMKHTFLFGDRTKVFDTLLTDLGWSPDPELIGEMVTVYRTHTPEISFFEDAEVVLREWAEGFELGLISDGPLVMQQRKVQALRLEDRIRFILLTDQWGREYWKPHPRAFVEIEKLARVPPGECLYIADNPAKDFVAPNARGWRTVQIVRTGAVHQLPAATGGWPQAVVSSLTEIRLSS